MEFFFIGKNKILQNSKLFLSGEGRQLPILISCEERAISGQVIGSLKFNFRFFADKISILFLLMAFKYVNLGDCFLYI